MPPTLRLGRLFLGIALAGWGGQNFIYGDFVLGRAPAWPWGAVAGRVFAGITGLGGMALGAALVRGRTPRVALLAGAAVVFAWAVVRHLIVFLPHPNWGGGLTELGKALTLFGGLLVAASAADHAGVDTSGHPAEPALVWTARGCFAVFLVACGIQHFLYAGFVATLVPTWIPGAVFWTYGAGGLLIAGGLGLLVPRVAALAALLVGVMILLWFLLLHVPRTIALPDSRTDWLALFESLGFSGIGFLLATVMRRRGGEKGTKDQGPGTRDRAAIGA